MSVNDRCNECGAILTAGSPGGLCARCLFKRGLEANTLNSIEGTMLAGGERWTPPTVEEVGMRFAELEVSELIGRGGMGAVYKARQKNLDRVVALKILPPEIGRSAEFAGRFAREAQAMAKLSHPHIVPIHDFGQRGNYYYFIMEHMDGLNLRQLMSTGNASAKEALAIVPQICEALQYAHDHGIVHRDIKPENILLNKSGEVKIADFGLAKLTGQDASGTAEKVCGTPRYMAPEQVDRPAEVDHRADIYSLGVVFYQMLTGELPGKVLELPSRKVQIDVRLDEIVLRALDQSPKMRFQNATQFKTEVETIRATPAMEYPPALPITPRFSRSAIIGAQWAITFFIALLMFFVVQTPSATPMKGPARSHHVLSVLPLLVLLLGATAPFGTTILGCVAISKIRRSAGAIYGLGLALFDALLFPLLILDGFILGGIAAVFHLSAARSSAITSHNGTVVMQGNMNIGWGLILCVLVDWLIVKKAWRAASGPALASSPAMARENQSGRSVELPPTKRSKRTWILLATLVLLALIAGILGRQNHMMHSARNPVNIAQPNDGAAQPQGNIPITEDSILGQWEAFEHQNVPADDIKDFTITLTEDHLAKYETAGEQRIVRWTLKGSAIQFWTEKDKKEPTPMTLERIGDTLVLHGAYENGTIKLRKMLPPQIQAVSDRQKVQSDLQTLRQQLDLYKIQHQDTPPTLAQLQNAWSVLTTRTDVEGNIKPDGKFGPYIMGQPVNPIMRAASVAPAGQAAVGIGWTYDEKTMKLKAVAPEDFSPLSPDNVEKVPTAIEGNPS